LVDGIYVQSLRTSSGETSLMGRKERAWWRRF
jgi:hypothetical protein